MSPASEFLAFVRSFALGVVYFTLFGMVAEFAPIGWVLGPLIALVGVISWQLPRRAGTDGSAESKSTGIDAWLCLAFASSEAIVIATKGRGFFVLVFGLGALVFWGRAVSRSWGAMDSALLGRVVWPGLVCGLAAGVPVLETLSKLPLSICMELAVVVAAFGCSRIAGAAFAVRRTSQHATRSFLANGTGALLFGFGVAVLPCVVFARELPWMPPLLFVIAMWNWRDESIGGRIT